MSNKNFPNQALTFNDLYFVCYMIERVARTIHQRNRYVVERMGYEGLLHELSIADTNHCLNPEQVVSDWIETYRLEQGGGTNITLVDPRYTDKVPTEIQMGKVYARLIQSVNQTDDLPAAIMQVYSSPICDVIDNYNTGAYYEPSYVQTRAYINGGF